MRGIVSSSLLIGGALLLTACASKPRFEPAELKGIRAPEVSIQKKWTRDIGQLGALRSLQPLVAGGRIFVAEAKGKVYAIDGQGAELWRIETGRRLGAGPALVDGQLILGDRDGGIVALAAANGEELWTKPISSEVITIPAGDADLLVVKSEDGRVHGLDPRDGSDRWVVPLNVPALTWRGNAPLVLTEDAVLVGTSNGRLKALSREDGSLLWDQVIAESTGRSEVERLTDVDGALLQAGPVIIAVSTGGNMKVLRTDGGQLIWERAVGGFVGASIDENCLYVIDTQDFISCLDPRSGAAKWTNEKLKYRQLTAAQPWKGNVVVADYDGYAHVLSTANGSIIARARLASKAVNWIGPGPEGSLLSLGANGALTQFDTQPLSGSAG